MTRPAHADWVGPIVAVVLCLLTPLVHPVISFLVALVAMSGMAIYYRRRYRRRTQMWVGAWAALVGAVLVSMAIVSFMMRE
jgi:hypothetical protein